MGTNTPRGIQPKADQAKLLRHPHETDHEYKIIENSSDGRILQVALEKLDQALHDITDRVTALENRGALSVLSGESGDQQIVDFASAYISDTEPIAPISGIDEEAEIIPHIEDGDLWVDTTNNVIKRYNGGSWIIKGAAYL